MSPIPLNWSERDEPDGVVGLHDCAYSAALDVLVGAGFSRFPLGIYTPKEREALERADDRKDETGATHPDVLLAVKRRYGVDLHVLQVTTTEALAEELAKPGRIFALAGSLGNFTFGDPLRRWQPFFTGGHEVAVVSGPTCIWLDPLAPNRNPGDPVPPAKAARFAWTNWTALYLELDELVVESPDTGISQPEADMETVITITTYTAPTTAVLAAGKRAYLYDASKPGAPVASVTAPATRATTAPVDASVHIERTPRAVPNGTFRRISEGPYAGLLIGKDDVELRTEEAEPDCSAAVEQATQEATAKANRAWRDWLDTAPKSS